MPNLGWRKYSRRTKYATFIANLARSERSHRSDQQEFYQLLRYKSDVDLEAKLNEWEPFCNFARPHGRAHGQPPTKLSETSFSRPTSVPRVWLGCSFLLEKPLGNNNNNPISNAQSVAFALGVGLQH
jgi:hypothetical protein